MRHFGSHVFLAALIAMPSIGMAQEVPQALISAYEKLSAVKSAAYSLRLEAWAPGDTVPKFVFYEHVRERDNSSDKNFGSVFASFNPHDTTQMKWGYDGAIKAWVDYKTERIRIDSFQNERLPYRPMRAPFVNYSKSILSYVLQTQDNIRIEERLHNDTVCYSVHIDHPKIIEFFGRAHYVDPAYPGESRSVYRIWLDPASGLPCKIRREMPHDVSVMACFNARWNDELAAELDLRPHLPANFSINGRMKAMEAPHPLLGKAAPPWSLLDGEGNKMALSDIRSRLVLLKFTSVTCGPCKLAIPMMNRLMSLYSSDMLEVAALETFVTNTKPIQYYLQRNSLRYRFLLGNKEVAAAYDVSLVPVFVLLDEQRIVRRVFTGYEQGKTDFEIAAAIDELIGK